MIILVRIFVLPAVLFAWAAYGETEFEKESDNRYRDTRRGGFIDEWEMESMAYIKSPEDIAGNLHIQLSHLRSLLLECQSSTPGIPKDTTDIIGNILGKTLPTTQARECLVQSLEQANRKICESQRKLDAHFRVYGQYYLIRNQMLLPAIERVRAMESNYKDRLYDMADNMADKMRNIADKNKRGGWTGFFVEEEAIAYESIFEEESYTDCYASYNYSSNKDNFEDIYY